jgi:ADP-dependent NAD(P)H-hydrate dehydratase / NAD(P)H-hydrate epimerase
VRHSIIAAMTSLPAEIYTVATVREIDRTAIEGGIPGYTLMTRAGAAAVRAARERFPQAARWQVVCGAGNNAGDGYVVARLAAAEGIAVSVVTLVDPASLHGDAATAYGDFAAEGGVAVPWSGELDAAAGLLVDAMLGSGLERDVEGDFAGAVRAIDAHPAPVLAIDIPTGLHGDSGHVLGCGIAADLTVTFVGLKTGLFLGEGPDLCGEIVFAGLEVPAACRRGKAVAFRRIDDGLMRRALPRRRRGAHKGDFGHVLVVGGGAGMPGAVRLCGEAALRCGAGLVSIATHPDHAAFVATARPELMPHAVGGPADLEPLLARADVVAFGPGLGRSDWAGTLFAQLGERDGLCVWDADALNWLAESPGRNDSRVITPHPGEAARLLGSTPAAVQGDRRGALDALQQRYGGTVVLKGAGSLISASAGEAPWLCSAGNPGMASAGMGDVLTGIIAALLAQGLAAPEAAAVGVEAHARAGDRAAAGGERGLTASDLLAELRGVVNP